jgi:hypothetical protein
MIKKFTFILFIILILIIISGCQINSKSKLIGSWEGKVPGLGYQARLVFDKDMGIICGDDFFGDWIQGRGKYVITSDNTLIIDANCYMSLFPWKIEDIQKNTFYLSGGGLSLVLNRVN